MSEAYHVDCECGAKLPVQIFEAGTRKQCSSCAAVVAIPSSDRLKELAGDAYPYLSAIAKVRLTAESGAPPFHGVCHCCGQRAAFSTPISLDVMVERHVDDDGGIRPTITGGVKLVVSDSEEIWQTTTFPLLLCNSCQQRFQADRFRFRMRSRGKLLMLIGLLILFLYGAYHHLELVAAFSMLFWVVGVLAWAARFRNTKNIDSNLAKWLSGIRWVSEAIECEDEFALAVGAACPYRG